jgi:hypothetical protein
MVIGMSIYQCLACGAVYQDPQKDGSSYFHACAPLRNPDYDAQFKADPQGNRVPKGPLGPTIAEFIERTDKRDENVERKPDGSMSPKTPGKGTKVVKG